MANLLRKKLALKRKRTRRDRKDENKFGDRLYKVINDRS
jgi:hypothetical protein